MCLLIYGKLNEDGILPFGLFPPCPQAQGQKDTFQMTDGQGNPRRCNSRVELFFDTDHLLSSLSISNQGPTDVQSLEGYKLLNMEMTTLVT